MLLGPLHQLLLLLNLLKLLKGLFLLLLLLDRHVWLRRLLHLHSCW